ncbi:MAG TPA: hypothetical protein PK264_18010 [Hyphomicrobiaceae bacterium]|nr:hypothetical protein [Hyphomicrobiaceae bacterium]
MRKSFGRSPVIAIAAIGFGVSLSACSTAMLESVPAPRGPVCDVASATVTMANRDVAAYFAKVRLAEQIGEVKSELSAAGVMLARAERQVQCVPYRLFGPDTGLYSCTASANVCSR